MKNKFIRLTLKKAKELIKKEFGLSGSALVAESSEVGVYIYKMQLGKFEITVKNEWNGLFSVYVQSPVYDGIQIFYDPNTLEIDYEASQKYLERVRESQCEGCSYKNGQGL